MIDEQFDVLASPPRRRLLVDLLDHGPPEAVPVPESVHEGERELEVLRIEMYHKHLPKLDGKEFVRWNRDAGEVTRGPRFDEIRPLLSVIDEHAEELPHDWP